MSEKLAKKCADVERLDQELKKMSEMSEKKCEDVERLDQELNRMSEKLAKKCADVERLDQELKKMSEISEKKCEDVERLDQELKRMSKRSWQRNVQILSDLIRNSRKMSEMSEKKCEDVEARLHQLKSEISSLKSQTALNGVHGGLSSFKVAEEQQLESDTGEGIVTGGRQLVFRQKEIKQCVIEALEDYASYSERLRQGSIPISSYLIT